MCLLFVDDVVLPASFVNDLQDVLGKFAGQCEVAGMRNTSESEAMFFLPVCLLGVRRVGEGGITAQSKGVQIS